MDHLPDALGDHEGLKSRRACGSVSVTLHGGHHGNVEVTEPTKVGIDPSFLNAALCAQTRQLAPHFYQPLPRRAPDIARTVVPAPQVVPPYPLVNQFIERAFQLGAVHLGEP